MISQSGRNAKADVPIRTVHISKLLDFEVEAHGIPDRWDSLDELLSSEMNDIGKVTGNLMIVKEVGVKPSFIIEGDEQLQVDIRSLLEEYNDIFRTDTSSKPAVTEPMEITNDREKWNNMKGNKVERSPRVQSCARNDEILRQIDKMKSLGIIRESQTNKYSQIVLAPKQNSKWRFYVDFQNLNSCCENEGWNIPNIGQMLQ